MNKWDDLAILIIVAALALGMFIGNGVTDASWRTDCKLLGSHVSLGEAYDCKPREQKP